MLKFLTKYGFSYLVFQKYRKNLAVIFVSVIFIVITLFVYVDVVEFLKNKQLVDYLIYALIGKWFIILVCMLAIFIAIKPKKSITPIQKDKEPVSQLEESILKKKTLKTKADLIIEEAKRKKKLG